jgi:hypothetical protein
MSSCVGINQFFNPNGRWKALRSATQNLQSTIWKFRSRVDVFEYDSNNPNEASVLFHSIIDKVAQYFFTTPSVLTTFAGHG